MKFTMYTRLISPANVSGRRLGDTGTGCKKCLSIARFLGLGIHAATCYYQFNHSKVEAIPLSALPKDTTNELASLSSHYPFFMLNVKQGSCEYQLKSILV